MGTDGYCTNWSTKVDAGADVDTDRALINTDTDRALIDTDTDPALGAC